ncbi:lactosylceramide 1,3-N-acetyl-beta-D-glucosaminyltransferase A [Trichomycterus rosablanca]|uniref:lactosylceramide 1,3-N-acetyl-beta-D-glucosaminyltransferase A n=1 Tax=Trichomycterus rosablanca TaxID=2290929 RepID=UPI002F35CD9E
MFRNFRLVRKWKFLQLISMCCVLSTLLVCWEEVDHHVISHVRSYSYRYLINRYDFINKSFAVSREEADSFGRFPYLINPQEICAHKDVLLLLFVKSSPENFRRRQIIRSTWGNQTYIKQELGVNVKVVYVMGVHPNPHQRAAVQKKLNDEDQIHSDLLQQNFMDTFHNLTIKLLLQFRWAHASCAHARFLMSSDDDVFVHMPNLVQSLQALSKQDVENLWIGHVHRGAPPVRLKSSKYYVSFQMYQYSSYPDYTAGAGYVVSREVAAKIYHATMTLNASLHIDDVFMGICAVTVGVSPQEHVYFAGEAKAPYHPCIYEKMITSHGHEDDVRYLWKAATTPEAKGISSGFFGNLYCKAVKMFLLCKPFFSNTYSCRAAFS